MRSTKWYGASGWSSWGVRNVIVVPLRTTSTPIAPSSSVIVATSVI